MVDYLSYSGSEDMYRYAELSNTEMDGGKRRRG